MVSMDRQGHATLCNEITRELAALGERLGVKFSVSGGQIGTTNLVMKVRATSADPSAAIAQKRWKLNTYGRHMGLTGDDYGAIFESQGRSFRLTGVNLNRPKFPLDGECLCTGKSFKFTRAVVAKIAAMRSAGTLRKAA